MHSNRGKICKLVLPAFVFAVSLTTIVSTAFTVSVQAALPQPVETGLLLPDVFPAGPGFAGKPVSLLTGAESLQRTDLSLGNHFPIRIKRRYHSKSGYDSPLGYGWAHNYDKRIYTYPDGSVVLRKETGWKRHFTFESGSFITPVGEYGILVKNADESFTYTLKDGTREEYDVQGRLAEIVKPTGASLVFMYEDAVRQPLEGLLPTNIDQTTPLVVAYDYRLSSLEEKDPNGSLTGVAVDFSYDPATGRLIGLFDSLGRTVVYQHDSVGNLVSVEAPGFSADYAYNDAYRRHLLTSINEGEGEYVNTYDSVGRVSRQVHGNNIIDFDYLETRKKTRITTTVTDDSGSTLHTSTRTVEFDEQGQVIKTIDTLGNETHLTRNAQTKIIRKEIWKNTGTVIEPTLVLVGANDATYDERGNLLSETEAAGTPEERITTYVYHPAFNRVLTETVQSVVDPNSDKVTTNVYDAATGNLLSTTETGFLGDGNAYSYTTGYQYNSANKLVWINGPRTDVQDVTTFDYDTAGNLTSVTRPLIGTTRFADFDGLGNPGTLTDPNDAVTVYTYSSTGQVLTVTAPGNNQPTRYTYTTGGCTTCGTGQELLDTVTLPEGTLIDYDYDGFGRLNIIRDSLGNSVNYTYDSAGNRLSEEIRDPQDSLQKSLSYQYDSLGRLFRVVYPDSSYREFAYDSRDNCISMTDPNSNTTSYQYDALNQMIAAIQPGEVSTGLDYDIQGNLTGVTDSNGNLTSYSYDDMGRVYRIASPDTGITTYNYDPAGNLTSKTDAKGITVSYSYDATNRLILIDYPNDIDISYTYDNCPNGKGRLCSVSDQSGSTAYEYTAKGQILRETKTVLGVVYTTSYTYDMNGNPTEMIYPGNRSIGYEYGNNHITVVRNNGIPVASGISYKPFGGMATFTYGNSQIRTIGYDNQYRITSIQTGSLQNLSYSHDSSGNITAIADNLNSSNNKTYDYDALDRLTAASGPWGTLGFSYDDVGNRQSYSEPAGSTNYSYQAGSNRLSGSSGVQTTTYTLDANGNTIQDGRKTYTYNQNNRLIEAAENGTLLGNYSYNALGQRVTKTTGTMTTVYHYDQIGQLIAESDASGNITTEYIYLNGEPLAKLEDNTTYYISTDHLGTPQIMADSAAANVWQIEPRPFGDSPTIAGTQALNLRFPGQYYDAETGLHQNWHRDYEPGLGRYVEADPIGFAGGDVNLYAYVGNRPVMLKDPSGLEGIGGGMYYVFGGEMSVASSTCCENNTKYEVKIFTSCGGVGLGLKGGPPLSSTAASFSSRVGCPRTRYYFKHENTFVFRSVDVQGDSGGPSAGVNLGNYGISTTWVFCSDTVFSKRKIGCCN